MNKYKISTILFILLGLFTLSNELAAQATEQDNYTVQVDGLGCPFCAYGLEKKFKEFEAIENVSINMETGVFTFTYPADQPISLMKIEEQVDKAGYTPVRTKIERANGSVEENAMPERKVYDESALTEATFFVSGNCNMCHTRIVNTSYKTEGVGFADWDKKTKMLTVKYVAEETDLDVLQQRIAEKGYDTVKFRAEEMDYDKLPACCQYKRNQVEKYLKNNAQ